MKRNSVTIKDIARNLSISHTTVSRVLSPNVSSTISEKTRARVMHEATRLGYQPNHAARALVTGRTGLLCLLLWTEGVHDDYHARVIHEAHAAVQNQPFELCILLASRHSFEKNPLGPAVPMTVDGIILYEAAGFAPALVDHYRGIPMVTAGAYQNDFRLDTVKVDLETPTIEAMAHLIGQGRKRIAYLGSGEVVPLMGAEPEQYIANEDRHRTYDRSMRAAGLQPEYIHTGRGKGNAYRILTEYLKNHEAPDAFFCHNDEIAIGAYRALVNAGVKIPEQTALVGCDGLEEAEYIGVPISTVFQPVGQVFELAIEALVRRMADPDAPPHHIVVPAIFQPRRSSLI